MKFHKSLTDRRLFGVCGGLGETFKVNSNYIRAAFVLLHFTLIEFADVNFILELSSASIKALFTNA